MAVWDIAELPADQQFEYWREVICRAFVPLTPHRTTAEVGFAARVETRPLAGLNRAHLAAKPQRTDHGRREVARTEGGYYFVNLQLDGRCATTVRGRTEVVGPGEFVLVDTAEPYFFHLDQAWRMLSFRVPHAVLDAPLQGRRPALGRPLTGSGAGAAVVALMNALWTVEPTTAGAEELVTSFAGAVAAATAERGDPDRSARPSGVSRTAIMTYVESHLGRRDLTVAGVCRRFAISPRTLHTLFADDTSFAATVRRLRLERAAAVLRDPATTATVTAVAHAHGFDDPTAFSRAFRRRFGVSPRDTRPPARTARPRCTNGTDPGRPGGQARERSGVET